MLAKRTSLFRSSGTAAARAAARASADAGDDIIDLTAGEIWSDLAPTIRDGAFEAIRKGVNRYTDTAGMMELREALAKKVSLDTGQMWNAEELITTTGAKQALFSAAMVVLNPGDEVIIPTPYWSTFPAQVLIAGGKPSSSKPAPMAMSRGSKTSRLQSPPGPGQSSSTRLVIPRVLFMTHRR